MVPEVIRGIFTGLGLVLLTVMVGMGVGFACSGSHYEVEICGEEVDTEQLHEAREAGEL